MASLRPALVLSCFLGVVLGAVPAEAAEEEEWLQALYAQVAGELADGKPLVVQVHVPLCDNDIIRCGGHGLGDGGSPSTNLYWSTSGGFKGWFRHASGWKRVHRSAPTPGPILEKIVWRKTVRPGRKWRSLGVAKAFQVYVVAFAWRGSAIAQTIDRYVDELYGAKARHIAVDDGTVLRAGGAAHIVAYVGHNGWMDLPPYDWKAAERKQGTRAKATIAVACLTADYLARDTPSSKRVPLLMTTSLLFAGAHTFEGAVSSFARGESLGRIRQAAAKNYARGQGKPVSRVRGAFINPSDRRWRRYR